MSRIGVPLSAEDGEDEGPVNGSLLVCGFAYRARVVAQLPRPRGKDGLTVMIPLKAVNDGRRLVSGVGREGVEPASA